MDHIKALVENLSQLLDLQRHGWVIIGLLLLVLALIAAAAVARLWRWLFGPSRFLELKFGPTEYLAEYPLPAEPAGDRCLTVEGVPVRLRLAILAPMGTQSPLDVSSAEDWLDRVLWGLGGIARRDRPRIRVWPGQLSKLGFIAAFARTVRRPEPEGQASRWILLAGQTAPRPQPILLGLALWAEDPVHIGRMTLEPSQWASVLRIQDR
jgi:hypothetical protein